MVSILPSLYKQLRSTLLDCGPFTSMNVLKAVFVDTRINRWRDDLPAAQSRAELVNLTIAFLLGQFNAANENALILFLYVLKDQQDPRDACYQRLSALTNELENDLDRSEPMIDSIASSASSGTRPSIPTTRNLLVYFEKKFRDQDLRKVYFLMGIGYDDLAGGGLGKNDKAMALIEYCEKRERLEELFETMCQVYPGLVG